MTPDEVMWAVHTDLPREAPGSEETTRLLLRLAEPLPAPPRVVDIGCGTGPATVMLTAETDGTVLAVDTHAPFLETLAQRARQAGLADRVETLQASMEALPVAEGSVDLLWAEGSAYIMGVDAALAAWRPLLSPQGVVVLTELEWTTPTPHPQTREFWGQAYPSMRSSPQTVAALDRAGWSVHAMYRLPDTDWTAYYGPMRERIEDLRAQGLPADALGEAASEITLRERHGSEYGYTAYVLRPR